jgi:hypothetical protein
MAANMSAEVDLLIRELLHHRQSARAEPLQAIVNDAVAALGVINSSLAAGSLFAPRTFTAPAGGNVQNYTPSPGTVAFWVKMNGTGGGGGGALTIAANATLAQPGGAGGYSEGFFLVSALPLLTPLIITFGAAGVGGDVTGSNGTTGADCTFDTLMTVKGGIGGTGDAVGAATPGALAGALGGAVGVGGFTQMAGGAGFTSVRLSGTVAWGGRGGIAPGAGYQIGRENIGPNNGSAGFNFGAGGGAACAVSASGRQGGAGGLPRCVVFEFG